MAEGWVSDPWHGPFGGKQGALPPVPFRDSPRDICAKMKRDARACPGLFKSDSFG